MRFIWAVVAFVIAAVMIGAGVAQRTIFQGPEAQTVAVQTPQGTPYTLIEGEVLNSAPGAQTLTVRGEGPVYAAVGRTDDLRAWLADQEYTVVTLGAGADAASRIQTSVVEPEAEGEGIPTRDPVASDLWIEEFQREGELSAPLNLPPTMSVLIASDGAAPAPADIELSWPLDTATPWAGPLIVGGAIILLVGVVFYVLGIRHARRSRGPRRKGLPMPPTEPIDIATADAGKGVISSSVRERGRRALGIGRRRLLAAPAAGLVAVLLAGCSADAWPQFEPSETPTPTETVIVPEGQQEPAVTQRQAERIVTRVAETVAEADAAMDPTLASSRLDGAALAERQTNYTLRSKIPEQTALAPIPHEKLSIVLPQAFEGWPRSVLTVTEPAEDGTAAPTIMLLSQADPWAQYKAVYIANLEASTEMPDLAAPYVGAIQVPPDSSFLALAPSQLAAAYADIINNGDQSPYWGRFDTEGDLLLAGIQANKQQRTDELNQTGAGTASLTFESVPGPHEARALATLESGAIVAVNVHENDTVTPTNPEAVIKLDGNPTVRALTGVDQSPTGFTTTYSDQLFFYVPAQGSTEKIRLLGYRSNILEAKVIP